MFLNLIERKQMVAENFKQVKILLEKNENADLPQVFDYKILWCEMFQKTSADTGLLEKITFEPESRSKN